MPCAAGLGCFDLRQLSAGSLVRASSFPDHRIMKARTELKDKKEAVNRLWVCVGMHRGQMASMHRVCVGMHRGLQFELAGAVEQSRVHSGIGVGVFFE